MAEAIGSNPLGSTSRRPAQKGGASVGTATTNPLPEGSGFWHATYRSYIPIIVIQENPVFRQTLVHYPNIPYPPRDRSIKLFSHDPVVPNRPDSLP